MQNRAYVVIAILLGMLSFQSCTQAAQQDAISLDVVSKVSEYHPDKSPVYYPDHIEKSDKTEVKTSEKTSVVILSSNQLSVSDGDSQTIYDFSKNSITVVNHKQKDFIVTSLYAIPAFKDYERSNRLKLVKFAEEKGFSTLQADPFELETMFGDDATTKASQKVKKQEEDGSYSFLYNGEEVATYRLSSNSIGGAVKDTYKKYLIFEHTIHPIIIENISKERVFFSSLSYRNKEETPVLKQSSFSMSNFKDAVSETMKAPENYQEKYAFDEKLNHVIKLSLTEKENTLDDYLSQMNSLLEQKNYLEASLVFFEYTNHTGGKNIDTYKSTIQRIFSQAPPNVQNLTTTIRKQPTSKEQLIEAIAIIETERKKNTPHRYILDIYLANYLDMAGQTEKARALLLEALEENPFLTGAYKDLGDKYFREFDMTNAWSSWDQMRKINPEHPLASSISQFEQQIRQEHPAYFQESGTP